MPQTLSKEQKHEYKGVGGYVNLSSKIINNGWGLTYGSNTYAKGLFQWDTYHDILDLNSGTSSSVSVLFVLYIANPLGKEVSIRVDYNFDIRKIPAEARARANGWTSLTIHKIKYNQSIRQSIIEYWDSISARCCIKESTRKGISLIT